MGYLFFEKGDFQASAEAFEELVRHHGTSASSSLGYIASYHVSYIHALCKAGYHTEALDKSEKFLQHLKVSSRSSREKSSNISNSYSVYRNQKRWNELSSHEAMVLEQEVMYLMANVQYCLSRKNDAIKILESFPKSQNEKQLELQFKDIFVEIDPEKIGIHYLQNLFDENRAKTLHPPIEIRNIGIQYFIFGTKLLEDGNHESALVHFIASARLYFEHEIKIPDNLAYCIAYVFYKLNEFTKSQFILRCLLKTPLFETEADMRKQINTEYQKKALNLKAAIEFKLGNKKGYLEIVKDLEKYRLSDVTIRHNIAIMKDFIPDSNDQTATNNSFREISQLVSSESSPALACKNLLLMSLEMEQYEAAEDLLSSDSVQRKIASDPDFIKFCEFVIQLQSNPEKAFINSQLLRKNVFKKIANLTARLSKAKQVGQVSEVNLIMKQYELTMELSFPYVMSEAKSLWEARRLHECIQVLAENKKFCNSDPKKLKQWKILQGHCHFLLRDFEEAVKFYEQGMQQPDSVLEIPAIVVANTCVCYIMISENSKAENVIKSMEDLVYDGNQFTNEQIQGAVNLCIVNIAIGTLYCSKENYRFGLDRVMKAFQNREGSSLLSESLNCDTWHHCKRCLLSHCDLVAKGAILMDDDLANDVVEFLEHIRVLAEHLDLEAGKSETEDGKDQIQKISDEAQALQLLYFKLLY